MSKKIKVGGVSLVTGSYDTKGDPCGVEGQLGWAGWIEPADKSWILFIPAGKKGKPQFYGKRTKSGAVVA